MTERNGNLTKQWLIQRAIDHSRTGHISSHSMGRADRLSTVVTTGTLIPSNSKRRTMTSEVTARHRSIVEVK